MPQTNCENTTQSSQFTPIIENQIATDVNAGNFRKNISNPRSDTEIDKEANLMPINDTSSVVSEQASIWAEDVGNNLILTQEIDQSFNKAMENLAIQNSKVIPHKLEVKLRYLLQIFSEASCLEFALLISMLLLDAASICRITNTAIRTGSLSICRQLRNGLKDVTRWSFHEWLDLLFFIKLNLIVIILF